MEADDQTRLDLDELTESHFFLCCQRPAYRNYALFNYVHYSDHAFPYEDSPRRYYGFMGTI